MIRHISVFLDALAQYRVPVLSALATRDGIEMIVFIPIADSALVDLSVASSETQYPFNSFGNRHVSWWGIRSGRSIW